MWLLFGVEGRRAPVDGPSPRPGWVSLSQGVTVLSTWAPPGDSWGTGRGHWPQGRPAAFWG